MAEIKKIVLGLRKLSDTIKNDLDDVLIGNVEALRSIVIDRITRGKDEKGSSFSSYSRLKFDADFLEDVLGSRAPSASKSFVQRAIDENRKTNWFEVRRAAGFSNETKNFNFTGEMLNSIKVRLEEKGEGFYSFIIEPRDSKNKEKLVDNEIDEGKEILAESDEEIENIVDDITDQILELLVDFSR